MTARSQGRRWQPAAYIEEMDEPRLNLRALSLLHGSDFLHALLVEHRIFKPHRWNCSILEF